MADQRIVGIIGAFTVLAVFGGTIYLSDNELKNTYVCDASGQAGVFYGGISSTRLSAYPYSENRTGSVACKSGAVNGKWYSCEEWGAKIGKTCKQALAAPRASNCRSVVIDSNKQAWCL